MSEVAIVAPLDVHKRLADEGVLGTYQLLLAHEVLADPMQYEYFWRNQKDQFIIMDNSLIELGHPLPVDVVAEAAELVGAKAIVLPDVLGDRAKTYKLFAGALEQAKLQNIDTKFKMLGVAQGRTSEETFSCGRDMLKAGADFLSVPRNLVKLAGTRMDAVKLLGKLGAHMHLLGFSNNLWDDFYTVHLPGVMGIDSAVPIWLGMRYNLYDETPYRLPDTPPVSADYGSRPEGYSQWKGAELPKYSIENVQRVKRWANTVGVVPTGK